MPVAVLEQVQYAGFLRRLAATLFDSLLLIIILTPLQALFTAGAYFSGIEPGGGMLSQLSNVQFNWGYLLLNDLLPMILVVFFWVRYRATPGKELMECEVVDATTHQNLRPGQALLRYIGYFLSLLPLGLGFFWIIWDKQKRGFHDILAHTVVLHVDPSRIDDLVDKPLDKLLKEIK